jgi:predicted ribosome quality control (RQC) complex YloA/Tae2 family protein
VERTYLESEYDLMVRARTEDELSAIREELAEAGYLRVHSAAKKQKPKKLPPLEYVSSDGYRILSGRSNVQNEQLTLREAQKHDIWLHTQKIPGSHTILITNGEEPPARTYTEAAIIAATNSGAHGSARIAVDYTAVRNVKKMPGGKPGMVVYEPYYTAFVTPDPELVASLRVSK